MRFHLPLALIVATSFACGEDDENESDDDVHTIAVDTDMGVFDAAGAGFLGGAIPAHNGYYDDRRVSYWNFGPAPQIILPIYVFPDVPDQKNVVGSISTGYSPWWRVNFVTINAGVSYTANDLKTTASIAHALEDGLITIEETDTVVNCPVVQADATLVDDPDDRDVVEGWAEGQSFTYLSFEALTIPVATTLFPTSDIHVLVDVPMMPRFEGLIGADLNGDSDMIDTNNVLETIPEDTDYSPLWLVNEREVPAGYPAVADSLSDGPSDTSPVAANIVSNATDAAALTAINIGPDMVNCPVVGGTGGTVLSP